MRVKKEFSFGHVKCEMPVGHQNEAVELTVDEYGVEERIWHGSINWKSTNTLMVN